MHKTIEDEFKNVINKGGPIFSLGPAHITSGCEQ